jgi:putative flippase GtrA
MKKERKSVGATVCGRFTALSSTVLSTRIVRYALVGGVAFAVDLAIFVIFAKLAGFNYLAVAAVGFLIATSVNYVLSIQHVFVHKGWLARRTEIALVFLVSAGGLAINQLLLWQAVSAFGIEMVTAKVVASAAVFLWNYGMRRYVIFRAAT